MKRQSKAERPQAEGVTSRPRILTAHVTDSIQHDEVSSKEYFGVGEVQV